MELIDSSQSVALNQLRDSGLPVVVFGAGRLGGFVLRTCRDAGIAVAGVCDNSPGKIGTEVGGFVVKSPGEALAGEKINVILSVADQRPLDAMVRQIRELRGERDALFGAQLVGRYFRFAEKPDYHNNLWREWLVAREVEFIHSRFAPGMGAALLSEVSRFITERCSLNCRDCAVLIPRFANPTHHPFEDIRADVDALCDSAAGAFVFGFFGGEPLLHPELDRIIEYAAGKENIATVLLTTNGTVLPRGKHQAALRHEKVYVRISNYGETSRKRDELIAWLEENNVKGETLWDQSSWVETPVGENDKRQTATSEERKKRFRACVWNSCFMVDKKRFYRCATQMNGVKLGVIPDAPGGSVDLAGHERVEARAGICRSVYDFTHNSDDFAACAFCEGMTPWRETVPPAIQVKRGGGARL